MKVLELINQLEELEDNLELTIWIEGAQYTFDGIETEYSDDGKSVEINPIFDSKGGES